MYLYENRFHIVHLLKFTLNVIPIMLLRFAQEYPISSAQGNRRSFQNPCMTTMYRNWHYCTFIRCHWGLTTWLPITHVDSTRGCSTVHLTHLLITLWILFFLLNVQIYSTSPHLYHSVPQPVLIVSCKDTICDIYFTQFILSLSFIHPSFIMGILCNFLWATASSSRWNHTLINQHC